MAEAIRKVAPAVDKREAILAAALDLFNELSFNGTPMPLVAQRGEAHRDTFEFVQRGHAGLQHQAAGGHRPQNWARGYARHRR